jgi:hypothetical protein
MDVLGGAELKRIGTTLSRIAPSPCSWSKPRQHFNLGIDLPHRFLDLMRVLMEETSHGPNQAVWKT